MKITFTKSFLVIEKRGKTKYYSFKDMKEIFEAYSTNENCFQVVINFVESASKDRLTISLNAVTNQATWLNTPAGVETAKQDIVSWIDTVYLPLNAATEATLLALKSNTDSKYIGKQTERVTDAQASYPTGIEVKSIVFANVGVANAIVEGELLKPGEITNYDAGSLNNKYPAADFSYDCTTNPGAELLIIYNY